MYPNSPGKSTVGQRGHSTLLHITDHRTVLRGGAAFYQSGWSRTTLSADSWPRGEGSNNAMYIQHGKPLGPLPLTVAMSFAYGTQPRLHMTQPNQTAPRISACYLAHSWCNTTPSPKSPRPASSVRPGNIMFFSGQFPWAPF